MIRSVFDKPGAGAGPWTIAPRRRRRCAPAFSLVEAVMAIAILSVMYVAALNLVGASRLSQQAIANNRRGYELAQDLLAEILQRDYWDSTTPSGFGPEAGESAAANRTTFDDVDDYSGFSETTLRRRDGTAIPDLTNWSRSVTVTWVDPNNLNQVLGAESRCKRIVVSVSYKGKQVATLDAVRGRVN